MFQEPEIELTGLQRLAIQATADQDRKVLNALTALLNDLEFHRTEFGRWHSGNGKGPRLAVRIRRRSSALCSRPHRGHPKIGNSATGGDCHEIYDD